MNAIIETFTNVNYLYLLPINNSAGFYKKFGFADHGSDHLLFKPVKKQPTISEVYWFDSQDDVVSMLSELETSSLNKRDIDNVNHIFSLPEAKRRHTLYKKAVEMYRDEGDVDKVSYYLKSKVSRKINDTPTSTTRKNSSK